MLNHREVLEALLAGKVLRDVVDIDIIVFKGTDGKLYNEEEAPITELYLEGWELSPEVIEINGIEVPKGETVVPASGSRLFLPVIHDPTYFQCIDWNGSSLHHDFLSKGLLHLTKEDAIAHAKALLSFTSNSDE
jgi:hypothetical protein